MVELPRDDDGARPPPRKKGRRRKFTVPVMNAEDVTRVDAEVSETTRNSRAEKTLRTYRNYWRIFTEWYCKNQNHLCTTDGHIDTTKIRSLCTTRAGLVEQDRIFKRCLMSRKHPTDVDENDNACCARHSTLTGYRASWSYHVWNQKVTDAELVTVPAEWTVSMKDIFKGIKNNEARRKQRGLLKCTEGKSKMSVMLFRVMGEYFHKEGDVVADFIHDYSWALMCRSFNVSQLHASALGWGGDCITVEYGQDKTKNDGGLSNKAAMLKHLYANPFEPAVRLISTPHISTPHALIYSAHIYSAHIYSTHIYSARPYLLRTYLLRTFHIGLHFYRSWTANCSRANYWSEKKRPTPSKRHFQEKVAGVVETYPARQGQKDAA